MLRVDWWMRETVWVKWTGFFWGAENCYLPEWDSRSICMWSPCTPLPVRPSSTSRLLTGQIERTELVIERTDKWQADDSAIKTANKCRKLPNDKTKNEMCNEVASQLSSIRYHIFAIGARVDHQSSRLRSKLIGPPNANPIILLSLNRINSCKKLMWCF